jgi:hypothetical protein
VEPDGDDALQPVPRRLGAALILEHAPARMQAHPEPLLVLHLQAVKPAGCHSGVGIAGHEESGRQVRPTVAGKVRRDRQDGEVGGLAPPRLDGEGWAVEHHGLDPRLQAPGVLGRKLPFLHAEAEGKPPAAGHDVRHDGHGVPAHRFE